MKWRKMITLSDDSWLNDQQSSIFDLREGNKHTYCVFLWTQTDDQ